jgi:hypothetical protein
MNLDGAQRARLHQVWTERGPALPEGFSKTQKVEWLDPKLAIGAGRRAPSASPRAGLDAALDVTALTPKSRLGSDEPKKKLPTAPSLGHNPLLDRISLTASLMPLSARHQTWLV